MDTDSVSEIPLAQRAADFYDSIWATANQAVMESGGFAGWTPYEVE